MKISRLGEMDLTGILKPDGVIDGTLSAQSERSQRDSRFSYLTCACAPKVCIIQADIRAIPLAKAAVFASAWLVMDQMGIDKVDRISLAHAFDNDIDTKYAMLLSMIPDCPLDKVSAAGTGARIDLLNTGAREEIESAVRQIEKIETMVEPHFQNYVMKAIAIPHAELKVPNLARTVKLPIEQIEQTSAEKVAPSLSRRQQRRL